jgi:hypothetical protein
MGADAAARASDSDRGAAIALAGDLLGAPIDAIEPVRRGRNSRVFRVAAGGRLYALKRYPASGTDTHDRLGSEVDALRLMQRLGVANVARIVAADPARHAALLTWLDGVPVTAVADVDIDAAADFLRVVHAIRRDPVGRTFARGAAEACLSGREAETQIRRRLDALRAQVDSEPPLARFLQGSFAPALEALAARAAHDMAAAGLDFATPLPQERRTLAPSDFGFHNALRRADGTLAFVDFEYFGWDDPVKLTADVLHHPGTPLSAPHAARFRAAALAIHGHDDPGFPARLAALEPLFGLRWTLILLNEFLPERWRMRVAAGETEPWAQAKARQLARARELFAKVVPVQAGNPHG